MNINQLTTAIDVEARWETIGGDFEVEIQPAGSAEFNDYVQKQISVYRRGRRSIRAVPDDVIERITRKAVARFVLTDWRGLADTPEPTEDGTVSVDVEVPYSTKKAEELFERSDHFYQLIQQLAGTETAAYVDTLAAEDLKGNSESA